MKKTIKQIILLLIITVMIVFVSKPVSAATSYEVELISNKETIEKDQEIEITIKVKDIVEIEGGIAGLSAKLEYDTTKLEKVGEVEGLNGFMLVEGNTIELAKYPGVTAETEIAKFKFKAKEVGSAQVKLTNIEVANGTDIFTLGKEVTKTITITTVANPPETLSNNNYLSKLNVDGELISNFNKDTLTYTLQDVENSKTSIEITAEAEDAKAKVAGIGKKDLEVGKNKYEIVVTAEDGKTKTYTVNIERKALEDDGEEEKSEVEEIPYAGVEDIIFGILGIVSIVAIVTFIKVKKFSGI